MIRKAYGSWSRHLSLAAIGALVSLVTACDARDAKPAEPNPEIKALRAEYGEPIRKAVVAKQTSPEDSATAVNAMNELLERWRPENRPVSELKEVLGEPSSVEDDTLIYRFDSGLGGWRWRFTTKDGEIVDVEKESLD